MQPLHVHTDCDILGCKYKSPFSLALEANDEKTALRLLKRDPAGVLSSSDAFGSALHCAARFGAAVTCGKLVRRGADPNETWVEREKVRTPLLIAVERAHDDVVQVLLSAGANARWHSHEMVACVTALHVARSPAVVRLLVAHGGDVNYACPSFVSGYGIPPALPPLAKARSFDVFAALLDAGAVPDAADKRGWAELHRRASANDRQAVQLLLRRAAWSQVALDQALAIASFNGSTDAVALLLVFGASASGVAERSDKAPINLARNEVVAALLIADGARQLALCPVFSENCRGSQNPRAVPLARASGRGRRRDLHRTAAARTAGVCHIADRRPGVRLCVCRVDV
jgi:ankyrin repeat protein